MFAFNHTFNPPPLRTGPFSPGGYSRDYFGPDLNEDQWAALVCEDWTRRHLAR